MKILIVGSGGREHAMAEILRRDAPGAQIWSAPGNPGMEGTTERIGIQAGNVEGLLEFAEENRIDLTVVGPEVPLALGLTDQFRPKGLPVFGPSAQGARLEASKAFAKNVMQARGVPTADYAIFEDHTQALDYVSTHAEPLVVKASGLAAGKGAIVCETRSEARAAIQGMMVEKRFGDAGATVVVEEFMVGTELSVFFVTDGERSVPLLTSRDYKRIGEGDKGLNTGGMGAYAPAAPCDSAFLDQVGQEIVQPVLDHMSEMGDPYCGFLYAGLMLTDTGPRVVEFNCRMGDPETQVVLPLLQSSMLEPMLRVAHGESLGDWQPDTHEGSALVTVVAASGYPGSSPSGLPISIPEFDPSQVRVFHAGTGWDANGRLVTNGGRVLGVTGLGTTLAEAANRSRNAAAQIEFEGVQYRRDIGWHEL